MVRILGNRLFEKAVLKFTYGYLIFSESPLHNRYIHSQFRNTQFLLNILYRLVVLATVL